MDRKSIIEKLNTIFCQTNKATKKYNKVWLTDEDFDGLYKSGKYVLNVQTEEIIDSCYDEISHIIDILDKEANEELQYIFRVVVYDSPDDIHCASEELVFDKANACP